jgi:hypothetical protein
MFIRKREVWLPTRQGFLLLALLAAALLYGAVRSLYPFLALNAPLPDSSVVIIEGWMSDEEIAATVEAVRPRDPLLVATGGPVFFGLGLMEEETYAGVTASRLLRLGVPPEAILCAPAPDTPFDRTYAAALAARDALAAQGLRGQPCTIYTVGAHSRRSLYLYRQAFGPDWPVGIVSLDSRQYDLRRWWRSSHAFKHVTGEWISWIYTLCSPRKYA